MAPSQPGFQPRPGTAQHAHFAAARAQRIAATATGPLAASSSQSSDDVVVPQKRRKALTPAYIEKILFRAMKRDAEQYFNIQPRDAIDAIILDLRLALPSDDGYATVLTQLRSKAAELKNRINSLFIEDDIEADDLRHHPRPANDGDDEAEEPKVTGVDLFMKYFLEAMETVLPQVELVPYYNAYERAEIARGPTQKTLVLIHIVKPITTAAQYDGQIEKVSPGWKSAQPTASPFGNAIPYRPSRIIARLHQLALDHYKSPQLVVSYAARLKLQSLPTPQPDSLPVVLAQDIQAYPTPVPPYAGMSDSTCTTAKATWQVVLLQEAQRRLKAGEAPTDVAKWFYSCFDDTPAPPEVPLINTAPGHSVVLSTLPGLPAKLFTGRPQDALVAAKRLFAMVFEAMAQHGRGYMESPAGVRAVSVEWYNEMSDAAISTADGDRLARGVQPIALAPDPCGAEFCSKSTHHCNCQKLVPSHPHSQEFTCSQMIGAQAAAHVAYTTAVRLRREGPLQFSEEYVNRTNQRRTQQPSEEEQILTIEDALAQPETILSIMPVSYEGLAQTVEDFYDDDDELRDHALGLLDLPVDIFPVSPFDGHATRAMICVVKIALTLSPSFDNVIQFDEGEDGTGESVGHTTASSRKTPSWAQSRKSRHLFSLMVLILALQIVNTESQHLKNLLLPAIYQLAAGTTPVDQAHEELSAKPSVKLEPQQRALSRSMNALIERERPGVPFQQPLATAFDGGVWPESDLDGMLATYRRSRKGRKWAQLQNYLGTADKAALLTIMRRLVADEAWLEQMTPRKREALAEYYKHRVEALQARLGGVVPKNKHQFVRLWFKEGDSTAKICLLASYAINRMLFGCNWRIVQSNLQVIAENMTSRSFFFALDVWVTHYLQHRDEDGHGLRMVLNPNGPPLFIPTLLAAKQHCTLMWDGRPLTIDELVEGRVNAMPQIRGINDMASSHHLSSLYAIVETTKAPSVEFLHRVGGAIPHSAFAQTNSADDSLIIERPKILNDSIFQLWRANDIDDTDWYAWEAKDAGLEEAAGDDGHASDEDDDSDEGGIDSEGFNRAWEDEVFDNDGIDSDDFNYGSDEDGEYVTRYAYD